MIKKLTGQTRLLLVKIELANGVKYFSILTCLKLDLLEWHFFLISRHSLDNLQCGAISVDINTHVLIECEFFFFYAP